MATHMSATPLPATNGGTHARGPQGTTTSTESTVTSAPSVNRKKQKRRQKQAARLAAENPRAYASGDADLLPTNEQRSYDEDREYDLNAHPHTATDGHYGYASPEHPREQTTMNGPDGHHATLGETSKRKKNRKARSNSQNHADRSSTSLSTPSATSSHPPRPPQSFPLRSRISCSRAASRSFLA
jgi:hypothetical protein